MPGPRRLRLSNVILSNASFTKTGWDLKPHIWNTLVSECELNLLDKPIVSLTVYVGLCVCVYACVRTGETVKAALYTRMSHTTLQSSSFSPLRGKERQRNQRRLNSPPVGEGLFTVVSLLHDTVSLCFALLRRSASLLNSPDTSPVSLK